MSTKQRIEMVVLVKAAPVLTRHLDETMCVAGVITDSAGSRWVRLHPVPFRDLVDEQRFKKYDRIAVDVIPPRSDRRPETCSPVENSVSVLGSLSVDRGWQQRREVVGRLPEVNMCDLVQVQANGSGPGVPSLGVVRPVAMPKLLIDCRDDEQLEKWRGRAVAAAGRVSLFDDPQQSRPPLEIIEWRFRYHYFCAAAGCAGHKQTIVDWEIAAFWNRVRHEDDWRERMQARFERDLWDGRDSVLFVGNQEEHPNAFLVLGIFWPKVGAVQEQLLPL